DAVETDMSLRQLLELAGALKAAAANGLEADMVPGYPLYIDEISYWIPDVELLRISVADALGIHVDPYLRERFERDAREYRDSIPSGARDIPDGEDNIGSPVRERQRYNSGSRRGVDERTTIRESRLDDDRRNDRTSEDERINPTERRTYDDERTSSTERRTYDEPQIERRTYDEPQIERRTYDEPQIERKTYDEPQIERRTIPEVDERIDEPKREEAPKTR
ncbi:MAG: hypothetical protein IJP42_03500, partial [Selenomonadaceae bacterium]|nr:hypothetical protein [Selenomonadaceae bacterium]